MLRRLRFLPGITAVLCIVHLGAPARSAEILWQPRLDQATFTQAGREHKFVLLDLHAVWCHWCHVMDTVTYADPAVQGVIGQHYVAVSVDADSDPALTSRYGDWGWPATIVLAADGTEIVKRRGYMAPAQMRSLLDAIVADPSPGPSIGASVELAAASPTRLGEKHRAALIRAIDQQYDQAHAGWGSQHKYLDAATLEWTFARLDDGDQTALHKARRTLDANLGLIDPVWGGVYQYSDRVDWNSPHYEKLLAFQADDLRLYSEGYALWHRERDLTAARAIYGYLTRFLSAPDGGFYASQDADVSPRLTGHEFYRTDDAARRAGAMPKIDIHEYSREAGWAIRALCKYYDVSGDSAALERAERAARWALTARTRAGGGFRHGADAVGGPFLDDHLALTAGFLALYRSTGAREWLAHAVSTLDVIDSTLRDSRSGYIASPVDPNGRGVFREPVRDPAQNASLVRTANMVYHYTGTERPLRIAHHGMRFLTALVAADSTHFHPDILLADRELAAAPIHITVVGHKDDPSARALHAAALRYPEDYLQVDWWDRREGKLPDPAITYPDLKQAAAFACTANSCSMPIFEASQLVERIRSTLN